jgi:hypothetical protein
VGRRGKRIGRRKERVAKEGNRGRQEVSNYLRGRGREKPRNRGGGGGGGGGDVNGMVYSRDMFPDASKVEKKINKIEISSQKGRETYTWDPHTCWEWHIWAWGGRR